MGLTATPRVQVDRNTYDLFDLEPGVPTDAYELATAVADSYLVPPKAQQVDLRFPREGIDYDSLSEEEQAQWESLDWGDDEDGGGLPDRVDASAKLPWLIPCMHIDVRRVAHYGVSMRTTLTIDDDVAVALRALSRNSGKTFKAVVNEVLRRGLMTGEKLVPDRKPFKVESVRCGFLPGVDPLKLNQLVDEIEVEEFLERAQGHGTELP